MKHDKLLIVGMYYQNKADRELLGSPNSLVLFLHKLCITQMLYHTTKFHQIIFRRWLTAC